MSLVSFVGPARSHDALDELLEDPEAGQSSGSDELAAKARVLGKAEEFDLIS